ncbi:MAG: tripartite tricarboxylate transporter TctB family protein [Alphaproteobacteria bacterium]|nr:tripartite tricarboxylate transporter TctB family protein [Alphaproteobacteria bacterium]
MSGHDGDTDNSPRLVSVRTMDIVVALVLIAAAGVVITDSLRLGVRWRPIEGPAAGYFPFYIGLILALSSAVTLIRAVMDKPAGGQTFVTKKAFGQVLAVLIPLIVYIVVLGFIGIYVASAIYIALFMWHFGKYPLTKGAPIGIAISLVLFLMFEVWFLVPLPKGPLEEMLGY